MLFCLFSLGVHRNGLGTGWLDLIRSCAVSSTSSCPQHLVDFQPTRVVKIAATAKRGHFHTGTLSIRQKSRIFLN
jgi:hypothetical protein